MSILSDSFADAYHKDTTALLDREQSSWGRMAKQINDQNEQEFLANPVYMLGAAAAGAVESVGMAMDTVTEAFGYDLMDENSVNGFLDNVSQGFGSYYRSNEKAYRFIADIGLAFTGAGVATSAISRGNYAHKLLVAGKPDSKVARMLDKALFVDENSFAKQLGQVQQLVKQKQLTVLDSSKLYKQAVKDGKTDYMINQAKTLVYSELAVATAFWDNENIGMRSLQDSADWVVGINAGILGFSSWRYNRGMKVAMNDFIQKGGTESLKKVAATTGGGASTPWLNAVMSAETATKLRHMDTGSAEGNSNVFQASTQFNDNVAGATMSGLTSEANPFVAKGAAMGDLTFGGVKNIGDKAPLVAGKMLDALTADPEFTTLAVMRKHDFGSYEAAHGRIVEALASAEIPVGIADDLFTDMSAAGLDHALGKIQSVPEGQLTTEMLEDIVKDSRYIQHRTALYTGGKDSDAIVLSNAVDLGVDALTPTSQRLPENKVQLSSSTVGDSTESIAKVSVPYAQGDKVEITVSLQPSKSGAFMSSARPFSGHASKAVDIPRELALNDFNQDALDALVKVQSAGRVSELLQVAVAKGDYRMMESLAKHHTVPNQDALARQILSAKFKEYLRVDTRFRKYSDPTQRHIQLASYLNVPIVSDVVSHAPAIRFFELIDASIKQGGEVNYKQMEKAFAESADSAAEFLSKIDELGDDPMARMFGLTAGGLRKKQGEPATKLQAVTARTSLSRYSQATVVGAGNDLAAMENPFLHNVKAETSRFVRSTMNGAMAKLGLNDMRQLYTSAEFEELGSANVFASNPGKIASAIGTKFFNAQETTAATAAFHIGTTFNTIKKTIINQKTDQLQSLARDFSARVNQADAANMVSAFNALSNQRLKNIEFVRTGTSEAGDEFAVVSRAPDGSDTPIYYGQGNDKPIYVTDRTREFLQQYKALQDEIDLMYQSSLRSQGAGTRQMESHFMGFSNWDKPFASTIRRADGSVASVVHGASKKEVARRVDDAVSQLARVENTPVTSYVHEVTEKNGLSALSNLEAAYDTRRFSEGHESMLSTYNGAVDNAARDIVDDLASVYAAMLTRVHQHMVGDVVEQARLWDAMQNPGQTVTAGNVFESSIMGTSLLKPDNWMYKVNQMVDDGANNILHNAHEAWSYASRAVNPLAKGDREEYNVEIIKAIQNHPSQKIAENNPWNKEALVNVFDEKTYGDISKVSGVLNQTTSFIMVQIGQLIPALQNITGAIISSPAFIRSGLQSGADMSEIKMQRIMIGAVHDTFKDSTGLLARMENEGYITNEIVETNARAGKYKAEFLNKTIGGAGWGGKFGELNPLTALVVGSERMSRRMAASAAIRSMKAANPDIGDEALMAFGARVARQSSGVYDASNRMGLFQSGTGMNFSLFLTFAVNYFEQLLNNIGKGNLDVVARQQAYQTLLFGVNSSPLMSPAIDVIDWANSDDTLDRRNMVDRMHEKFGNEFTDTFLLGSLSTLSGLDLHTPGDASRLPIPLASGALPSWSLASNIYKTTEQLVSQSNVEGDMTAQTFYEIMAHTAISRPTRAIYTSLAGNITDSSGQLIDQEIQGGIEWAATALGTKTLSNYNKQQAEMRMRDKDRLNRAERTKFTTSMRRLVRNNDLSDEGIAQALNKYIITGGSMKDFQAYIKRVYMTAELTKFDQAFIRATSSGRLDDLLIIAAAAQSD